MRSVPGARVEELTAEFEAAAAKRAELEAALEREKRDAADLEPRRMEAVAAHAAACAEYERIRDETPAVVAMAADAIDRLVEAWAAVAESRRGVDRLGAEPEAITPRQMHQTREGRQALESMRTRLLSAI